ncbi:MAG: sigma-70 family RNA polymerase sigma factor [Bryobacterales bacterium]|nr:sigma-70 family RNA polymerase sigma factor [Bryobacterales bacterium]
MEAEQSSAEITQLLGEWSSGKQEALDTLVERLYPELKRIANRYLSKERAGHTLQSTALVNEAYLRLVDQKTHWANRAHFLAVCARVIRGILVDYARARKSEKRGGGAFCLALDEAIDIPGRRDLDLMELDQALKLLAELDERQSRIVELRYFGGLSIEETAEFLHLSTATVKRDWAVAKAWIRREILRGATSFHDEPSGGAEDTQ